MTGWQNGSVAGEDCNRSGILGTVPISDAVITARTPPIASAGVASIARMRACATGLRRIAACSRPSRVRSATYCPRPRRKRRSSIRRTGLPMYRLTRVNAGAARKGVLALTGSRNRRRRHRSLDLIGAGECVVFASKFRRQDLDHRLVLEPDFDHVKRPPVAAEALPAFARRDLFDGVGVGSDAEGKMGRSVTSPAVRSLLKAPAVCTAWPKLGPGGIDLDTRSMIVELKGEKASGIGRKRHRGAAHELSQDPGDPLGLACGNRKMMDHALLLNFPGKGYHAEPARATSALCDVRTGGKLVRGISNAGSDRDQVKLAGSVARAKQKSAASGAVRASRRDPAIPGRSSARGYFVVGNK